MKEAIRDNLKKNLKLNLTYRGLIAGSIFGLLSLTPSLLPRTWIFQGILTGVTIAFGYGLGNLLGAIYSYLQLPEPGRKNKAKIIKYLVIIGVITLVLFIFNYVSWNNDVRSLMGMEPQSGANFIGIFLMAAIMFYSILIISRGLRGVTRVVKSQTHKIFPRRFANVLGGVIAVIIIIYIFNGLLLAWTMSAVNSAFSLSDSKTDPGITKPESSLRSGGQDSLVKWDTLGRQGRKFTGGGPTAGEISDVTGQNAQEPIRVYAGLKSADTIEKRAQLALEELKRTNAFERDILVVATTTGTGWLDPGAADSIEYLHNGNTAIVGLQYSYLPSWISLFVDQQITIDTSTATLNTIHDYWSELDENNRPELYVFGLSLGSFGAQESSTSMRLFNDPVDGGLYAGSPFVSEVWSDLTENRDEGSPEWRPVVDEGRVVRFTGSDENALFNPEGEWGDVKYAYLQHASDPIVFFSPWLLFNSPDWLEDDQRGPDVSTNMFWIPGVTFWQVAADLPMAGAVPLGHGHAYSPETYLESWAAVTEANQVSGQTVNKITKELLAQQSD